MELALNRVEADLGTWTVAHWSPAPTDLLHGLVDSMFYWDGLPTFPLERTFPNGRASLYVQLDDPYRPGDGIDRDPYPAVCVDGLWTEALVVEAPPRRARVLGVKFTPIGAVKILNTGLTDLGCCTNELEDVVGKSARELGARASAARNARAAVAVTIAWLRERAAQSRDLPAELAWIANQIESMDGVIATRKLLEACSASASRLSGAFRSHFGLSPKRFARIMRFRKALELLAAAPVRLADIAGVAGYYDQAHFTAEFKLHAGLTPSAFLSAQRYPGSPSLAESERDDFSKTSASR